VKLETGEVLQHRDINASAGWVTSSNLGDYLAGAGRKEVATQELCWH